MHILVKELDLFSWLIWIAEKQMLVFLTVLLPIKSARTPALIQWMLQSYVEVCILNIIISLYDVLHLLEIHYCSLHTW